MSSLSFTMGLILHFVDFQAGMDEEEDRTVGNYMLLEVIGEGSFSEVKSFSFFTVSFVRR